MSSSQAPYQLASVQKHESSFTSLLVLSISKQIALKLIRKTEGTKMQLSPRLAEAEWSEFRLTQCAHRAASPPSAKSLGLCRRLEQPRHDTIMAGLPASGNLQARVARRFLIFRIRPHTPAARSSAAGSAGADRPGPLAQHLHPDAVRRTLLKRGDQRLPCGYVQGVLLPVQPGGLCLAPSHVRSPPAFRKRNIHILETGDHRSSRHVTAARPGRMGRVAAPRAKGQ